ncbi:MAG: sulfurtransferase [Myxococcales bacterium]|nr:sulfurtransferase [Myxococcales bacterium]MDH3485627.1 sulfurtransferase [Myxococcales bacterium]
MDLKFFVALLIGVLVGCGGSAVDANDGGLPDGSAPDGGSSPISSLVVDADWLMANLDDPNLQPVDTRGAPAFEVARIPGAVRLSPEQVAMSDGNVPMQVAPPMQAEPVLRAAGLRNDSIAVVYGAAPEYDPARVVWTLRYYGHGDVRYLDGGYAAWLDAGGTVDTDPPTTGATDYTITDLNEDLRVTGDSVLSGLGDAPYEMPSIQLVDARSPQEYDAGRIPTARHVQWTASLDAGFLRSMTEIQALHDRLDPSEPTVTYCLTGWRGSFAWLALTYLGYENVQLYDGSWAEWENGAFPVEQ